MREIIFYLNISADEYLRYYRGGVRVVHVRSVDGRRINFPANRLVPFVSHDGVIGRFALQFDDQNRYVAMRRLD